MKPNAALPHLIAVLGTSLAGCGTLSPGKRHDDVPPWVLSPLPDSREWLWWVGKAPTPEMVEDPEGSWHLQGLGFLD